MKYNSASHELFVRFIKFSNLIAATLSLMMMQPAAAGAKTIVVFGDSLVAGYGLAPGEAFPDQLAKLLEQEGFKGKLVNAGVSGDTTTGGLARLDWSIQEGTDAVILELGANDALRGVAPHQTRKNLVAMIKRLRERNIAVLLVGMKAPPNMGDDYVREFDSIYPELAKQYDLVFYPFFLDGVAAVASLNQSDGIHPTAEGISLIAEKFLPVALKFIEKIR